MVNAVAIAGQGKKVMNFQRKWSSSPTTIREITARQIILPSLANDAAMNANALCNASPEMLKDQFPKRKFGLGAVYENGTLIPSHFFNEGMSQALLNPANMAYGPARISAKALENAFSLFLGKDTSNELSHLVKFSGIWTSGGTEAISRFLEDHLIHNRGTAQAEFSTWALQSPCWPGYLTAHQAKQGMAPNIVNFDLFNSSGEYNIDGLQEVLETNKHVVLTLTTPDNPTGFVIPKASMLKIAKLLNEHANNEGSSSIGLDLAYVNYAGETYGDFLPAFINEIKSHLGKRIQLEALLSFSKTLNIYGARLGARVGIFPVESSEGFLDQKAKAYAGQSRGQMGNPNYLGIVALMKAMEKEGAIDEMRQECNRISQFLETRLLKFNNSFQENWIQNGGSVSSSNPDPTYSFDSYSREGLTFSSIQPLQVGSFFQSLKFSTPEMSAQIAKYLREEFNIHTVDASDQTNGFLRFATCGEDLDAITQSTPLIVNAILNFNRGLTSAS